jgi:hypothetical protein
MEDHPIQITRAHFPPWEEARSLMSEINPLIQLHLISIAKFTTFIG